MRIGTRNGAIVWGAAAAFAVASSACTLSFSGYYEGNGGAGGTGSNATASSNSVTHSAHAASTSTKASTTQGSQTATSSSTGPTCTETACTLTAPQSGCCGSDNCTVDATGAHFCVASGTATTGQACSAINACALGDICLGATVGTCFNFCSTDNDCTAPGGHCVLQLGDGMGGAVPNVSMCSQNCDPTDASSCNVTGLSCQAWVDTPTGKNYTSCVPSGGIGPGGACPNGDGDCQAGLDCANFTAGPKCAQWCRVGVTVCPGALTCQSFTTPFLLTPTIEYGVCN